MSRLIRDALLVVTRTLPAANANNDSTSIDLGDVTPALHGQNHELSLEMPALPNLANGTTATVTVTDSADNSSFAAVPAVATLVLTGAGGTGSAATTRVVRLPSTVRRYIRVNVAVANSGGDNTASTFTFRILS
jgi:hypothetical protein